MRISENDDFYNRGNSGTIKIILGTVAMMAVAAIVIGAVLYVNRDIVNSRQNKRNNKNNESSSSEVQEDFEMPQDNKLTAEQLDFWNMYDDGNVPNLAKKKALSEKDKTSSGSAAAESDDDVSEKNSSSKAVTSSKKSESDSDEENEKVSGVNPSGAGEDAKTFNAADSGDEELIEIFDNIPQNAYVADSFRQEGNELQYYSSNRKASSFGIDVSKYQGEIDWEKVAGSGIDFAMIRMGVRGYSTGQVVADEQFVKNMDGAKENGIDTGIYFYSQAVTVNEAVEEANYAVAAARSYNVVYPIVFYSERISSDIARTDGLSADELSAIAKAFCDTVKGYGYKSMICATKHRLAVDMDISTLKDYDIWLVDAPLLKEGDKLSMSEYPYMYTMWQYSSTGKIDGIEGDADLNISFVDYKYR